MIRHSPNVVTLTDDERLAADHFDRLLEIMSSARAIRLIREQYPWTSKDFRRWLVN